MTVVVGLQKMYVFLQSKNKNLFLETCNFR
jgi:hypothetical protein